MNKKNKHISLKNLNKMYCFKYFNFELLIKIKIEILLK